MHRPSARRAVLHGAIVAILAAAGIARNTDFSAPPRFDGAGYAVLAQSLALGQGYREIDHPDRPRHAHFPPGYPVALGLVWGASGLSWPAAHLLSLLAAVGASVATWRWFRMLYPPRTALLLGLALAVNWTWARIGGSIQSEPLFLLLSACALLACAVASRRGGIVPGIVAGMWLGACILTRQVGLALVPAVLLDLALRRRWAAAIATLAATAAVVLPWAVWLTTVRRNTQVGLLPRSGLGRLVMDQALFYARRIPDQITGPLVEIATVFRPALAKPATAWAILASGLVVWGWLGLLRSPRRRLAGLIPASTLLLLLVWPFTEAGRFLVPLVPFLLLGAVEGLARLGRLVGLRNTRRRAAWAVLAVSIPYSAYALATDRAGAARRTDADFEAACTWIARQGSPSGPVLARHPGDVFLRTGRTALVPPDDPEALEAMVRKYGVAFLLIDDARYVGAPSSPLGRYAAQAERGVREVWRRGGVAIYRVPDIAPPPPRPRPAERAGRRRPFAAAIALPVVPRLAIARHRR